MLVAVVVAAAADMDIHNFAHMDNYNFHNFDYMVELEEEVD